MAPHRDTVNQRPFTGDFPLRKVANLLPRYTPPPVGAFTPVGSWQQSYAMCLLTGPPLMVGKFSLKRTANGSQGFELDVMIQRSAQCGFSHFQRATMQCRANALASPSSWVFESKMAKAPEDKPYLESGRTRNASVAAGTLVIRNGARVHKRPIAPDYSNEWSLLEAVQRLPGDKLKPISYTLIDEYDAPQSGHTLSYRGQQQVDCQDGPLKLTSYMDIGQAVVPTTYSNREDPRLCWGGSRSLRYSGVDPETPRREPPSKRQGATGWMNSRA